MSPDLANLKGSAMVMGQLLGNAMSVNVMERLTRKILIHTGRLRPDHPDRWQTDEAIDDIADPVTLQNHPTTTTTAPLLVPACLQYLPSDDFLLAAVPLRT